MPVYGQPEVLPNGKVLLPSEEVPYADRIFPNFQAYQAHVLGQMQQNRRNPVPAGSSPWQDMKPGPVKSQLEAATAQPQQLSRVAPPAGGQVGTGSGNASWMAMGGPEHEAQETQAAANLSAPADTAALAPQPQVYRPRVAESPTRPSTPISDSVRMLDNMAPAPKKDIGEILMDEKTGKKDPQSAAPRPLIQATELASYKQQQAGIKDLEASLKKMLETQPDWDVGPLLAYVDSTFGGNQLRGYRPPERTRAKLDAQANALRLEIQKAKLGLTDQEADFLVKQISAQNRGSDIDKLLVELQKSKNTLSGKALEDGETPAQKALREAQANYWNKRALNPGAGTIPRNAEGKSAKDISLEKTRLENMIPEGAGGFFSTMKKLDDHLESWTGPGDPPGTGLGKGQLDTIKPTDSGTYARRLHQLANSIAADFQLMKSGKAVTEGERRALKAIQGVGLTSTVPQFFDGLEILRDASAQEIANKESAFDKAIVEERRKSGGKGSEDFRSLKFRRKKAAEAQQAAPTKPAAPSAAPAGKKPISEMTIEELEAENNAK